MVEATIEDLVITMRTSTGKEAGVEEICVNMRSSEPPRRAVRNGVKNLHGSKTIPKSQYKAVYAFSGAASAGGKRSYSSPN
jgi:hypothetical protein